MTPVFRLLGPLLLLGALASGLGGCGRKGPLEAPPYAAADPAVGPGSGPGAAGAATAEAAVRGATPGAPLTAAEGAGPYATDNPAWNPTADRTAGVSGATSRETIYAPAARERSRLDWLVD